MDQRTALIAQIEAFIAERGIAPTTFGRLAVNDGKFVARIKAGGDLTSRTADRVRAFMQAPKPAPKSAAVPAGAAA
jgi:hypothetical protein